MIDYIPVTLDIIPFLGFAAFIIGISSLVIAASNVSIRIKFMLPMLGVLVLLLHLFWIASVIGRPVPGIPPIVFHYLHHRTTYIDQKAFTELWIKDKKTDKSYLYRFPRDPKVDQQLQKIQKEQQKDGRRPKELQLRRDHSQGRLELDEIFTPPIGKSLKEPPTGIENWDGTM